MGYSGLENYKCGDVAADLAYDIVWDTVKALRKGLKEEGNGWNPEGCVNVALILESMLKGNTFWLEYSEFTKLLTDVSAALLEHIQADDPEEWDHAANRKYHLDRYRALRRRMERLRARSVELVRDGGA